MKQSLECIKPWPKNPYLVILRNKLVEIAGETDADPRGMIFVKTRATAFSLASYLNNELGGIGYHAAPFTGTTYSGANPGMHIVLSK